jgi:prepilin-type processing-associated H-X9-DG protein
MHNYHSAYQSFPPAVLTDKSRRPLLSWRVAILPYLGPQGAQLYSKFNLSEPWDSPENRRLLEEMPNVFRCPSDPASARMCTPYQVLVGKRTMFPGLKSVAIGSVTDGTSNTILVGEGDVSVFWTAPQDLSFDMSVPNSGLGSFHGDEFNIAFADGSTRALKRSISGGILGSLISRNGGEVIPAGY